MRAGNREAEGEKETLRPQAAQRSLASSGRDLTLAFWHGRRSAPYAANVPSARTTLPRCPVIADEALDGRPYSTCDGWSGNRTGADVLYVLPLLGAILPV